MSNLDDVQFDSRGLVPAIIQDADTGQVLTLAYMNRESIQRSIETGETWFFSRSRHLLWHKGETSGHTQQIVSMTLDCDSDAILVQVRPAGPACHIGEHSCFHKPVTGGSSTPAALPQIMAELYAVIQRRQREMPEGSYTAELLSKGTKKIAQKVGEEAVEVALASVNESDERLASEVSDLLYHLLVLLAAREVPLAEVARELAARRR